MSTPAHYIVFHPERKRQPVCVHAVALEKSCINYNWRGNIWVDSIGIGNEDPYVFNDTWLYSYCHASQLRKSHRWPSYLQPSSKILFVSGQHADKGYLCIDTVFVVGKTLLWQKPLGLPLKFQTIYKDLNSHLWHKHFKFPFENVHEKVSHTYEAAMWKDGCGDYAYLPIDISGQRVVVPISSLNEKVAQIISRHIRGKYPVLLTQNDIDGVIDIIESVTTAKVVEIKPTAGMQNNDLNSLKTCS